MKDRIETKPFASNFDLLLLIARTFNFFSTKMAISIFILQTTLMSSKIHFLPPMVFYFTADTIPGLSPLVND